MSAILSADDLNDFISPGVACIKPVETLPIQKLQDPNNLYEVTTEDKLPSEPPPPAQISLTDCLACSGCVTSAEAVLVSLQSHSEVLNALDSSPSIDLYHQLTRHGTSGTSGAHKEEEKEEINKKGRIFVASVSPQVRASLAATYGTTDEETGWMIEQLLSGPAGIKNGGAQGSDFAWIVDTNAMREACLVMGAEELQESLAHPQDASEGQEGATSTKPKKPILTSACPGWICYAEKTHPHILPHLSRLKSPQALTGTLLKTVLSKTLDITPDRIWHLSIMPCFDKKLEASREELTDINWQSPLSGKITPPVRDVDCVITARELLMLAETRGISFPSLPRQPVNRQPYIRFPDKRLDCFLFTTRKSLDRWRRRQPQQPAAGSSGGYLYHILLSQQGLHPGSTLVTTRGRNADVIDYTITHPDGKVLFRGARYYGFRNIQNLVRKLKPARKSRLPGGKTIGARKSGASGLEQDDGFSYVEVMACPGGCTNGGGQIKVDDVGSLQGVVKGQTQKEWLAQVDEAYYSATSPPPSVSSDSDGSLFSEEDAEPALKAKDTGKRPVVNGIAINEVKEVLNHWSQLTNIPLEKLVYTSYRKVESDVGKFGVGGAENKRERETRRVVELSSKTGGGW
ncbi:MAG: Cytosolic Fe-S cluster assembly factor nar1 [Icmadophila ericetorum]|nr:Cytosolic Fe-S cluster assembly factor nar1 [Icmadophila ericetorum]